MVVYWVLKITNQTIFVSTKYIISRIMKLLHNNFVIVCNILMWKEVFQDPLVLRPTYPIFREKTDTISLLDMALGVMFVLFSSPEHTRD